MEFYSNTRKPARIREKFDNQYQTVYRAEIDKKTGERRLVEDKKVNIYDKIQEYAEETKISNILKNYNLDMLETLKDKEQKIIDITNLPENLMETMAVIDTAKGVWDAQAKEIKAKFNNDFKQFIAASENGQLANLLENELKTARAKFTPEVQAQMQAQPIQPTAPVSQGVSQPVSQGVSQTMPVEGVNYNV